MAGKTIYEHVVDGDYADTLKAQEKKWARLCNRGRCPQYKRDRFKARTNRMGLPRGR